MKIYVILLLQILFIILTAGCTDISEELISGEEIANKFIEKQENFQDYSATATITTTRPGDTFTVKIMFKKPNKYKIEYLEPSQNLRDGIEVTDGSTGVWNYHPEAKSADHHNESPNMDANSYFYGRDYYIIAKNFIGKSNISYIGIETIGEHNTYVIEAIPEKPLNTRYNMGLIPEHKIRIWIDTESWIIQKMVTYDEENNFLTKIESIDTKFNIGIPDAEFIFEPPEGVEIHEMPSIHHSKPHINYRDIAYSTPSKGLELISIVFPETWLMENDENEDPRIINVSFPALQLYKLLIDNEEYAHYLTPEEIVNNEKVALLTMPKTMFTLFNKDTDTVVINFPTDKFEFYPNVSEMIKMHDQVKYVNSE
ncbi:MAG: outer membrane lipoprotein carrier protein LolA [Methanosarcinales archaeon]|nr:outer membrane lipoprotein carrier protein LolA [Methanosarcinales archaeon]